MSLLRIRGIHYGLTLIYSYLIPLLEINERDYGFSFEFKTGVFRGIRCLFRERDLFSECYIPSDIDIGEVVKILGLEKNGLFRDICRVIDMDKCISSEITLIYHPGYRREVFYSIYLSRNTDYYVNTVKWVRELIEKNYISSSSYIPRQFNKYRDLIDSVFRGEINPLREVIELLRIPGVGLKSINAYLLHSHGDTRYAPIDRYYSEYLGLRPLHVDKNKCVAWITGCNTCRYSTRCPYKRTMEIFGVYNGVIQSLIYIYNRLKSTRSSRLEQVLIKEKTPYMSELSRVLDLIREKYVKV